MLAMKSYVNKTPFKDDYVTKLIHGFNADKGLSTSSKTLLDLPSLKHAKFIKA